MRRIASSLAALALLLFPLGSSAQEEPRESFSTATVVLVVQEVREESTEYGTRTRQLLRMRFISGPNEGETFELENSAMEGRADQLMQAGETVVVETITNARGERQHLIRERYRLPALGWLFAFFVGIAFVLGGRTSVMSVLGLLVSIGILIFLVMPRILEGWNPMGVSLAGSALIACTSLYLAHGFKKRTSVALLSTLLTLGISAVLALIFVKTGKLFGLGSEEAMFLQVGSLQNLDLRGLLLGGILIGCLGVLDDITTAQTAAIDEISKANPALTPMQLRKAGFSVGKEHIASLINTLALAYVGASLPLLLLFHIQTDFPLWVTLNGEFLAEEIVRTLVGSATLLFAVPISTWCASTLLRAKPGDRSRSGGAHPYHSHSHA